MIDRASSHALRSQITSAIAAFQDAAGAVRLPEIAAHIDSALPERSLHDPTMFGDLLGAMLSWIGHLDPEGLGGLGFWRDDGLTESRGDQGAMVITAICRPPIADTAETQRALERVGALSAALGGSFVTLAESRPDERQIGLLMPRSHDPNAEAARFWGTAFERRRLLFLRDVAFPPGRLRRSLAGLGLDSVIEGDLDTGLRCAAEASAAGSPFDAVVLCARLCGSRFDAMVDALRSMPGGENQRIIAVSAEDGHMRNPGIDGAIPRHGPYQALLTVLFDLLRRPRGQTVEASPSEVPSFVGRHLLIAEDVAMNRALLQAMLTPTGATYEIAENGEQAVEAMRRQPADLVLMDIQMPVMDGLEATRRIRALSAGVKVIALTANAREADRSNYLAAGMNGYIAKPIRVDDLYAILRRELG